MKRPVALALTIVIFAAIAVCFLRPAREPQMFGYADMMYTPSNSVAITDCTGDTELLRAVSYSIRPAELYERENPDRSNAIFEVTLVAPNGMAAITANSYAKKRMVNEKPLAGGYIERRVGSDWEWQDDIWVDYTFMLYGGTIEYPIVRQESQMLRFYFEWDEPGEYRLTYLFREHLDDGSTSDELYSISHTIVTPEIIDAPFDVQRVEVKKQKVPNTYTVKPVVMINRGSLYIDRMYAKLEKCSGKRWVEAEGAVGVYGGDKKWRYRGSDMTRIKVSETLDVHIDDPAADYRLTLHFVANPDGSGEQYTLTLRLRFDE